MKTMIIYHSKTGFSQRYAQWLAESLHCEVVPYRERKAVEPGQWDTIILVGGLYAGRMSGLNWLKKQPLEGKRAAAVAVGCSPMGWPNLEESMAALFGGTEIQGFYCQGGLDYERMGAVDRAMMAALRVSLKGKPEMAEMLKGISHSFDGSRREYLDPVIDWASSSRPADAVENDI